MTIIGLILDGGSGQRLGGVRKGGLRLGNRSLLEHVAGRLRPQCDILLYSYRDGPAPTGLPVDALPLADRPEGPKGPVAALFAAAHWCAAKHRDALLVSVSVDTPFVPQDFVARAHPLLGPNIGCVTGSHKERDYPTVALWRLERLGPILDATDRGPKGPRMRDIQNRIGSTTLAYTTGDQDNPFAGANTLAELLELERRLQAATAASK